MIILAHAPNLSQFFVRPPTESCWLLAPSIRLPTQADEEQQLKRAKRVRLLVAVHLSLDVYLPLTLITILRITHPQSKLTHTAIPYPLTTHLYEATLAPPPPPPPQTLIPLLPLPHPSPTRYLLTGWWVFCTTGTILPPVAVGCMSSPELGGVVCCRLPAWESPEANCPLEGPLRGPLRGPLHWWGYAGGVGVGGT